MKKQYPLALAAAAAGVLVGGLFLTGNFSGISGQGNAPPAIDHNAGLALPLDVKNTLKDRQRGLDAVGSHYFYVDENFVDEENHCEFCIFVQYKPGAFGRAAYAFESKTPIDLADAKTMTFLARGDVGGETIRIYAAGKQISMSPATDQNITADVEKDGLRDVDFGFSEQVVMGTEWVNYEVDLSGLDLAKISHPFAFELKDDGSEEQIVYLDLIVYNKEKQDFVAPLN